MPTQKAKKTRKSAEDVARDAFPGFDTVKRPSRDDRFLSANSTTPAGKTLHKKYGGDSAVVDAVLKKAKANAGASTEAVVVEPRDQEDAASKRLTVLVKKGKIRAVQG